MQSTTSSTARQIRELRERAERVTVTSSSLTAAAILGFAPHSAPIRRIP